MPADKFRISFLRRAPVVLAAVILVFTHAAVPQQGVSIYGASRTQSLADLGQVPSVEDVVVEDWINYHRHCLPMPRAGRSVGLDVRWGGSAIRPGGYGVLQVGFTTPEVHDTRHLPPLNLVLVMDCSGSMADADKMDRVKESLLTLVNRLRSRDILSIVAYDDRAWVAVPAACLEDRCRVKRAIRRLEPGGYTNLHAGLMLGFEEACKHFDSDHTNRVLLLTDGIANRGVTDTETIVRHCRPYYDRGIDLATIGVGKDLNRDLLEDLARGGRGLFHFVADAKDIQKVFLKEVQSLMAPAARCVRLDITPHPDLEVIRLFGYQPKRLGASIRLHLNDMNHGVTQVVLVKFKARSFAEAGCLPVEVRLAYQDVKQKKPVVERAVAHVRLSETTALSPLEDVEVKKNYTIARMARTLKDMARAWRGRRYEKAETLVNRTLNQVRHRYPSGQDRDIRRVFETLEKYRAVICRANAWRKDRCRESCRGQEW